MKPVKIPAAMMPRPYISPALMTRRDAAEEPLPPLLAADVEADPPPKPVYTAPLDPVEAAAPPSVAVAAIVLIVDVFTRVGFWAPQGLFAVQADWQELSLPQLFTQSILT